MLVPDPDPDLDDPSCPAVHVASAVRARTSQLDTDLLGRYTKLQERLKAERRALKILRASAAEERGQRAQALLAETALPRVVGESVTLLGASY